MLALADRNAAVRAAAATALSAYPSEDTVTRLAAMLVRESEVEVRARACSTLVDMFLCGTVEALDPLLGLLQDPKEDRRVRTEALKVLSSLPPSEARAIASGLTEDADPRVARAASRLAGPGAGNDRLGAEEALTELDSPDYFTYRRAASLLASIGEPAVPILIAALKARAADAAACSRVASVLREIARGRERAVARYLDEVDDTVPLGLLVDIIGESRDRTALYHLKGVIDRMETTAGGDEPAAATDGARRLAREMIVAKAHYYLARAGSRVAFDSLKATLSRSEGRLIGEILLAAEEIGGREELVDLLDHYAREEGWMRQRIRESFRRIMKKARVRSDDPIFDRLDATRTGLLLDILEQPEQPANGSSPQASQRRPRRSENA